MIRPKLNSAAFSSHPYGGLAPRTRWPLARTVLPAPGMKPQRAVAGDLRRALVALFSRAPQKITTAPRGLVVAACLAVAMPMADLTDPRPARANCALPSPKLVWSYPADGATDVPTNVGIYILTSLWQHVPAEITVNGVAVPRSDIPFGYKPVLAPQTKYVVTLPGTYDAAGPKLSFAFTTGAGVVPFAKVLAPKVDRITMAPTRPLSPVCEDVWRATACFDTGQNVHAVFETTGRPLFWLIQRAPSSTGESETPTLWPASCGDPSLYVAALGWSLCRAPFQLRAVGATGDSEVADIPCATTPATAGTSADPGRQGDVNAAPTTGTSGGCAVAGVAARAMAGCGTWTLLAMALVGRAVAAGRRGLRRRR